MAQSNGMGFWRRSHWGRFRKYRGDGTLRRIRGRQAAAEIEEEMDSIPLGEGYVLRTHPASSCAQDPSCCIHNPSDHSMRDFPQNWRGDRGLMERVCSHGVGHPDPDDIAYKRRRYGDGYAATESIHGCDGCCG